MTHAFTPDELRPLTWTAILLQLVYLAVVVFSLWNIQEKLDKGAMEPAMPALTIILAAVPAAILWSCYALITRTSLHSRRSIATNVGMLIAATIGLSIAFYGAAFAFFAMYAITHAPH